MTALQSIIKDAQILRKKSPKMEWKKAVAQASAIYASKHKGKSPVGKKKAAQKNKKVGALPVGFKGSIYDIGFKIVNQYDIYNDVSAIMEDINTGNKIVTFDGKGSAKDKAEAIVSYISKATNIQGGYRDDKQLYSRMLKFATNMQKEVKDFNSGKKKTIKKQPLNIVAPKVKKIAQKKSAPKKAVKKHHTHWGTVHTHERRVNGVRKKKISEQSILNKIHKVKDSVSKLDEAQHKHMSVGRLNMNIIKRLEDITKEIEQREDVIANVIQNKTYFIKKNGKSWYPKFMKLAKGHISELKKHKSELKRFI